jgi:hypothetical protein
VNKHGAETRKMVAARTDIQALTLVFLVTRSALCANLVQDGSFEVPPPLGTKCAGATFGAWVVERGSVDIEDGSQWMAAHGSVSIDLSGTNPCGLDGSIYQDLLTSPGASYKLRFALAGNFLGGAAFTALGVSWSGAVIDWQYFNMQGRNGTDMGWTYHEFILSATGSTTRLTFFTPWTMTNGYGPVIDDVSVEPAPCGGRLDMAFDVLKTQRPRLSIGASTESGVQPANHS